MRKDGVAGEELEIYDRETREVLARRIFYYYQSSRRQVAYGAPIPVCPQIKLPKDPAYIGGQPRNSYEFVARVLKPPSAWPDDARDFALVRGGGRQVKECAGGYVWIGPGLAATDLAFARQDQNLIVTVAGSSDSLLCRGYFSSGGGPGMAYRLRFFDSGPFSDDELRAKLAPEGRKAP